MIASVHNTAWRLNRTGPTAQHSAAPWLLLLGCLALVPNPALQVGNLRLQIVNFVLLLYLMFRLRDIQSRAVGAWLLLAVPAVACAVVYLASQFYGVETLKLCALWLLGTTNLVAGTPRDGREARALLHGVSIGILLNLGFCLLQVLTIPGHAYPFWSWYGYGEVEASMIRGFQSGAGIFGVRAFGLFAEPSDMTASIGHWWLLLCGLRLGLGGVARFANSRLVTAALFGGAALLMLSRSGHVLIVGAGLAVLLAAALRARTVSRMRAYLLVLVIAGPLMVGLYDLKDRIANEEASQAGYSAGSVWQGRAASIRDSLLVWESSPARGFIFGLGYDGVERIKAESGYNIWSVIGKSILTFGLLALAGWLALGAILFRELSLSRARILGLVFGGVCVTAIAITTSAEPLASPWLALGMLLSWRQAFGARLRLERAARVARPLALDAPAWTFDGR